MVGPKKQDFWPRIEILKGKFFKKIGQLIMVRQKVPKSYFQSQLSMSKIKGNFFKKISQFSMSKINRFKKIHLRISI